MCIEVAGFDELPEALARRLVRRALIEMGVGRDLTRVHLFRALTFCKQGRPGARVEFPGGVVLARDREEVHLTRC